MSDLRAKTAPDGGACEYIENARNCHEPAAWLVRISGREHGLCDRHSRREFHPPDLHNRLPGAMKRTLRRHP